MHQQMARRMKALPAVAPPDASFRKPLADPQAALCMAAAERKATTTTTTTPAASAAAGEAQQKVDERCALPVVIGTEKDSVLAGMIKLRKTMKRLLTWRRCALDPLVSANVL